MHAQAHLQVAQCGVGKYSRNLGGAFSAGCDAYICIHAWHTHTPKTRSHHECSACVWSEYCKTSKAPACVLRLWQTWPRAGAARVQGALMVLSWVTSWFHVQRVQVNIGAQEILRELFDEVATNGPSRGGQRMAEEGRAEKGGGRQRKVRPDAPVPSRAQTTTRPASKTRIISTTTENQLRKSKSKRKHAAAPATKRHLRGGCTVPSDTQ